MILKNKVERSAYPINRGGRKGCNGTEQLITDQTGKPVEYCSTEDTYADTIWSSISVMTEKTIHFLDEGDLLEKALKWNQTKKVRNICLIVGEDYRQNGLFPIKNAAHLRAIFAGLMPQLSYLLIIKIFVMNEYFLKRFEKKDPK